MAPNDKIAKNLVKFRKENGLTQADVAKYLNVTRTCYAGYEQGVRGISFETALKLGELFGISAGTLGYKDEDTPPTNEAIKQCELYAQCHATNIKEAIKLAVQLDTLDLGRVIGTMEEMLRADKYRKKENVM